VQRHPWARTARAKSTLAYVMAGKAGPIRRPKAEILLDGEKHPQNGSRTSAGGQGPVSWPFQYPLRNPGRRDHDVPAHRGLNAQRKKARAMARGFRRREFLKLVPRRRAGKLEIDNRTCSRRGVNVGLLRRREEGANEILQMAPACAAAFCVLDETDFRPRYRCAEDRLRRRQTGCARRTAPWWSITHYQRLLDHIVPDVVHVLSAGRIRQDRRQGGSRSSSKPQAMRNSKARAALRAMNAEVRNMKTNAELALGPASLCGGQGGAARRPQGSRPCGTRGGGALFDTPRPAAPARSRSGNIPICERLFREAPTRSPVGPTRPPRRAPKGRRKTDRRYGRAARVVFVDGRLLRPDLSDLGNFSAGLTHTAPWRRP